MSATGHPSWQTQPSVLSAAAAPILAAVAAESVGDPESTRRVYTTIVIFVALGVAMIALAVWLFRRTRPEPQLLAPLEAMDSRRWRRSEPAQRRRELDDRRPDGARPLERAAERPAVDSEFAVPTPVRSFDDLADRADSADATDAIRIGAPVGPDPVGNETLAALLDGEANPESDLDAEPDVENQVESDAESEAESDGASEAEPDGASEAESDDDDESDTDSEIDTDADEPGDSDARREASAEEEHRHTEDSSA